MHEHKLVAEVLDEVLRVAAAEGPGRVSSVRIRLSETSHVKPEQFRDHFRLIATGTAAASAEVEISLEPKLDGELLLDSIDVGD